MSVRNLLASFIKSRESYDRVADKLEDRDLNEQERLILGAIREYYSNDPLAGRVDDGILKASVCRSLPNPKHQQQLAGAIEGLCGLDISPANVVADFIAVRLKAAGDRLATALVAGKSGAAVSELIDEYREWASRTELDEPEATVVQGKSAKDLVAVRLQPNGLIRIAPGSLNERVGGGLLRGHHVIVFARPEVGKTAFLVNAAAQFARQGLKVQYFGNEDPIDDIVLRTLGRMAMYNRAEIMEDPEGADAKAAEAGYHNIRFVELAPGTPGEIEDHVADYKPDVVIIDQLRNLNAKEDNFVRALEKSASAVRNIGKRHAALVLSATQAGDSASGKSVLDMGDVDNSNTGIPAQADVLLGIGMSAEDAARGYRVLSLCKNKPGGNHDFFPVAIDPSRSYLRSLS